VDASLRDAVVAKDVHLVSPIDRLCNAQGSPLTIGTEKWTPLAWEAAHLSIDGSDFLVRLSSADILP
jgi:hypothetical protein